METKRIAIFSGGGAKGLIQMNCMAELQNAGKKDFVSGYDLIVGSSVGAINGSVMALGIKTPQELLALYPTLLGEIFKKKFFHFVPIYDRENFVNCWTKYIGPVSTPMKACKTKLVVSSVDVCSDTTRFFKSWEDSDGQRLLVDAVLRSFAAPLYFGQINDPADQKVWYDGGMGNHNIPIDYGFTEAVLQGWVGQYEVYIDAYGTGYSDLDTPYDKASKQDFIKQLINFMNPGEGGMARTQSRMDQVRKMIKIASCNPNLHFEYYDIEIPKSLDKMDDLKHQKEYIEFGKKMAEKPLRER